VATSSAAAARSGGGKDDEDDDILRRLVIVLVVGVGVGVIVFAVWCCRVHELLVIDDTIVLDGGLKGIHSISS